MTVMHKMYAKVILSFGERSCHVILESLALAEWHRAAEFPLRSATSKNGAYWPRTTESCQRKFGRLQAARR